MLLVVIVFYSAKLKTGKEKMYLIASEHCIVFCSLHMASILFTHFLIDGSLGCLGFHP